MQLDGIELNEDFTTALRLMEAGPECLFITGKAGTGKSTLLEYFRQKTRQRAAVLAPTGVAAVNIKGQTIHSFFGFKPDITVAKVRQKYRQRGRRGFFAKLETIVIDEISMVRADLLDCVDAFLRMHGPKKNRPFGGIKMIFFGDLYQLPPVVTGQERELFQGYYDSPYFFAAKVMGEIKIEILELNKIYRQKDERFIKILNAVRNRSVTGRDLFNLNRRLRPEFEPGPEEMFVYLTTTNQMADGVNQRQLEKLDGRIFRHRGEVNGEFEQRSLPAPLDLELKAGAQVMLTNNDKAGRWINGSVGKVAAVKNGVAGKVVLVELAGGEKVEMSPYTWENFRYYFDRKNGRLESEATGSFTQYPLILAWAVTIHKSQGKTFDRVVIDIGRGTFVHGQAYVALSRCTGLEGIVLKKKLEVKHILMDWRVVKFLTGWHYQKAEKKMSVSQKLKLISEAINEEGEVRLVYLKANDEKSERVVKPGLVGKMEYCGREYLGMEGYCLKRKDFRVFRLDRILEIERMVS